MWFTFAKLLVLGNAWLVVNWESGLARSNCGEGRCSIASLLQLCSKKRRKTALTAPGTQRQKKASGANTDTCEGQNVKAVSQTNRESVGPEYPQQVTERFNNFEEFSDMDTIVEKAEGHWAASNAVSLSKPMQWKHKGSANSQLPCRNLLEWKWGLQGEANWTSLGLFWLLVLKIHDIIFLLSTLDYFLCTYNFSSVSKLPLGSKKYWVHFLPSVSFPTPDPGLLLQWGLAEKIEDNTSIL